MRNALAPMVVLALTGCGGGGVAKRPDIPAYLEGFNVQENVAGTDLRDTWKPPQPLQAYFDLGPHSPAHSVTPRFSGTILGSRDGITYTQNMSGPTDTIDIDFTGYFSSMPDFVQGALERAGKSWSHRLIDVLGPHQLTDEVVTRLGRDANGWTIPYENDGILVDADTDYQNPAWDFAWRYSRGRFRETQSDGDDFMARSGWLELAAKDIECCGDVWMGYLAAHEVGHAIGHAADDEPHLLPEHIARHVDFERGEWTGPAVTASNRGRRASFQEHADGDIDFGHLDACPMIMSYCGESRMIPHEMDFAFMKDIGYTVADEYPSDPEVYTYGAWAEHSSWSVTVSRALVFDPARIDDYIGVKAEVMGFPSENAFADIHSETVTWNGSLLAAELTSFAPVFGEAEITLSVETMDGMVAFTELETVRKSNAGDVELVRWRDERLDYFVSVVGTGFQDDDGRVMGTLYGPSHEEAAGTLHDEAERIAGAFGGTMTE